MSLKFKQCSRGPRWLALSLLLSLTIHTPARADVVAVVSVKSPINSLSRQAIADIFLGRSVRFPDGTSAVPIDQEEGSPSRDAFYAAFAGKTPAQLKTHWSKIIFTGRGRPPVAVPNGIEARKLVAANPQGITYVDRSLLDDSVRMVRVE